MNKIFFAKKSEMTEFAEKTGLEYFRTKHHCDHVHYPRPSIIIINNDQTILSRLVKCKPCAIATGNYTVIPEQTDEHRETGKGDNNV